MTTRAHRTRLVIVFPSREIGGAERYIRTIALATAARGWRVAVAFPAADATDGFRAELECAGVDSHVLPIGMPHRDGRRRATLTAIREAARTLRVLASLRASTTLVMLPHPDASAGAVLGAALFPARATVVAQHVPRQFAITASRRRLYTLARQAGQRWVAVSEDNRARLAAAFGWARGDVSHIPNGVDIHGYPGWAEARATLAIADDTLVLLTVARLSHQKGLDVLASAIRPVAEQHPHARWLWAGDGDQREELPAALEAGGASGHVSLLGHRDDVPRLLAAADLFVLPSRSEGLPFALLEAMAAGVPVIASELPMIREVVVDGVHGLLVPAEDSDALADAMSWALSHPREMATMAAAAAAEVRSRYRADEMVARTIALLEPEARRAARPNPIHPVAHAGKP